MAKRYQKPPRKSDHLYILAVEGTSWIKVGRTVNIEQRLVSYSTHLPTDPIVLLLLQAPPTKRRGWRAVSSAEAQLLQALKPYHIRGEWFEIHPDDLREILAQAVQGLNNEFLVIKDVLKLIPSTVSLISPTTDIKILNVYQLLGHDFL